MKKYIFPYGFRFYFEKKKVFAFPAIELSLSKENSQKEFSFLVLVDSGAEISLFTKSDAELLGLSLARGEAVEIGSASGDKFLAFKHTLVIKIRDKQFKVKVAFSSRDDTPRLLGRDPIFNYFFVIFDNEKQRTIFIPRTNKKFEQDIYGL